MIYIYRFLINIIIIFAPIIILIRLIKKKEDYKRFLEKFTLFSKKRKKGNLIWFHAVSVGELLSIIPLVKKIEKNKKISQILITTSTFTSSKLFEKYKFNKTIHQFFPIDGNFFTKRFINFWKPNLAIFVDSEIWPNMLYNLKKRSVKKILLNARISEKSYEKWKILGSFSKNLFQFFDFTYPQNLESKKYLNKFESKNIKYIGNLKFSQNSFQNNIINPNLKKFIKSKKLWCAVSTHAGEEKICAEIHSRLIKKFQNLVLIIIPRHTDRIKDIERELSKFNLKRHIHSNRRNINKNTNIYLVDTYGETNIFFNICKNIFIGKSLTVDGGQNPLEPARSNCLILHGPKVSNFKEIYEYLDRQKISFKIRNSSELEKKIRLAINKNSKKNNIKNKLNIIGNKILNKYEETILSII